MVKFYFFYGRSSLLSLRSKDKPSRSKCFSISCYDCKSLDYGESRKVGGKDHNRNLHYGTSWTGFTCDLNPENMNSGNYGIFAKIVYNNRANGWSKNKLKDLITIQTLKQNPTISE